MVMANLVHRDFSPEIRGFGDAVNPEVPNYLPAPMQRSTEGQIFSLATTSAPPPPQRTTGVNEP